MNEACTGYHHLPGLLACTIGDPYEVLDKIGIDLVERCPRLCNQKHYIVPEGWRTAFNKDDPRSVAHLDEKGRRRLYLLPADLLMYPLPGVIRVRPATFFTVDARGKIDKTTGQMTVYARDTHENVIARVSGLISAPPRSVEWFCQTHALYQAAEDVLTSIYSSWRDPFAYWDDPPA